MSAEAKPWRNMAPFISREEGMSAMSPMRLVARVGHAPHKLDRKKYGEARLALYWADPSMRFEKPGLWLWVNIGPIRKHFCIFRRKHFCIFRRKSSIGDPLE